MTTFHPQLNPRSPFAGLSIPPTSGRGGVIVSDRHELALATVLARKDESAALVQRLHERFGIELPHGPSRTAAGDLALLGIGPRAWLAMRESGSNELATALREALGGLASISDQSGGHAVLRLSGSAIRAALGKMIPVDLHPRVFKTGHVAVTAAGHIGATLWRLDDDERGAPRFEIAVFRSTAADFWHLLAASAAEFGFTRVGDS